MRSEFRLKSFGLTHHDPHVFTRTPWLSNQLPFVLYRAVVCLYQVAALLALNLTLANSGLKLLIFLTQWAYIVLTLHIVVSAGLCFADYYMYYSSRSQRGEAASDDNPLPWYYKLYWILYNVAFCSGICVTLLYWILLRGDNSAGSILTHSVNSVTIVIDVMLSGLPCRLLHFVYPSTFGLVYIIFSVIYWAAGGTGLYDYPFIYPYLDYGGRPDLAAIVAVLGVLVAVPLCHCIVFALALVRETLVRLLKKRQLRNSQNVDMTPL
ncbi:PREDICTED: protein rolling stone-like [Branchiostoma belcheri]|uniref:Protein rolling stone-like n=1 Tax=Branchiostoma belcheri TaxID=7741 RepID=A0A6P5AFR2_BRABE|nr:PREDICTED: protein rolling stone-like [Branchiostoma belcheri]